MKSEQKLKEEFFIRLEQFLIYENRELGDCPELVTKEGLWKLAKEIGGQNEPQVMPKIVDLKIRNELVSIKNIGGYMQKRWDDIDPVLIEYYGKIINQFALKMLST